MYKKYLALFLYCYFNTLANKIKYKSKCRLIFLLQYASTKIYKHITWLDIRMTCGQLNISIYTYEIYVTCNNCHIKQIQQLGNIGFFVK